MIWDRKHRRSIPALAGERTQKGAWKMTKGVYPRACGGTGGWLSTARVAQGLSPRLRGNVGYQGDLRGVPGSIPALAGERVAIPVAYVV